MRKTAVARYLAKLTDGGLARPDVPARDARTVAQVWARKLHGANHMTLVAVVEALIDGAPVHSSAWSGLVEGGKVRTLIRQRVPPTAALVTITAGAEVALTQRMLVLLAYNRWLLPDDPWWQPFKHAIRKLLTAGRILEGDDLRWLAGEVMDRDTVFGVFLLAHTSYQLSEARVVNRMMFGPRMADDYGAKIAAHWPKAVAMREHLCATRWLRGQVSTADWRRLRGLAPDLLASLYPEVWAAGYAGYAQAMAAKRGVKS